jgi:hypothetical protein
VALSPLAYAAARNYFFNARLLEGAKNNFGTNIGCACFPKKFFLFEKNPFF